MSVTRGPVQWVIIPLKKYAQFSGRASRAEYWWFNLAMLVIGLTFDLVDRALESEIGVLGALFNLVVLVPTISVTVRRLHDTDRTGWWIWVPMIPATVLGFQASQAMLAERFEALELTPPELTSIFAFVSACALLTIFMILRGTRGSNRFGPDPYG